MASGQTRDDRLPALKQAVVETVNELYEHGLITPTGGNVSVRLPDTGHILITASQIFKGGLGPEHVLEVDDQGRPVREPPPTGSSGARIRPSVETGMHLAVYASRPDVGAVVHTHAPLATVWSLFEEPVPPLTLEAVRFTDLRTVPFAPPGSNDLAVRTAEALARGPAVLLRNHGLVTVGRDLREALNITFALEESLKTAFMARLAVLCGFRGGEPALIPPKAVEFLRKVVIP